MSAKDFLLEIGCEELPADYVPNVIGWEDPNQGLAAVARTLLKENQVVFEQIEIFATPRRLVLSIKGVEDKVHLVHLGPPEQVAFKDGEPTPAAVGFAKKIGVEVGALQVQDTDKGPRVQVEQDLSVEEVLATTLPEIVSGIVFPKTMRWDSTGVRFARPIRWLLALYGATSIGFNYGEVASAQTTQSTRRQRCATTEVKDPAHYFEVLKAEQIQLEQGIVLPYDEAASVAQIQTPKKQALYAALSKAAEQCGGVLTEEPAEAFNWLLTTATFLAEDPRVCIGSFDEAYLALPVEVLATSMAKHLKLFGIKEASGEKLRPHFLAILEGDATDPDQIMANYRRILEARFVDAKFFFGVDTQTPLGEKVAELDNVVFHQKLGSLSEKIGRVQNLGTEIADQLGLDDAAKVAIARVAELSKADLVTQMVREFPTLQGVMGRHYAVQSGESAEVAEGIEQHYWPRTTNDAIPSDVVGAVASLADRLDTLIGFFSAGLNPTGSQDPYALRRQALGVVRILTEPSSAYSLKGLSIDRLIRRGIESWGLSDVEEVYQSLMRFLRERFEWLAIVREGQNRAWVGAVLSSTSDDLTLAWDRVKALQSIWDAQEREGLIRSVKVAERTGRIVRSQKEGVSAEAVKPELFEVEQEKVLWEKSQSIQSELDHLIEEKEYNRALETYGQLHPDVSAFFDAVLVMDEDPSLRQNRLALMNSIHQMLAGSFADLSDLPAAMMDGVEVE